MSIGTRAERKERGPAQRPLRNRFIWTVLAAAVLILFALVVAPSFMHEQKAPAARPYLVYRGVRSPFPVVVESGEAYVPFEFIKEVIDPDAFAEDGLVVVTTKDKVVKMKTDSLTAYVNQHPVELKLPVTLEAGEPYIPASALELLYPVSTSLYEGEGTFIVRKADEEYETAEVTSDAMARAYPTRLSRRVAAISAGTEAEVFENEGDWTRIQTGAGIAGWVPAGCLSERTTKPAKVPEVADYVPLPIQGDKIRLVWEQVERRTPETAGIGPMPGLNVVSPTWFRLGGKPGDVENYSDARYVSWAHERGYQVWALFSNSFELERTRAVLRDSDLRDQVIAQMLMYAHMYSLDGINLDFENVYQDDAPYLTQFVRELTPLMHEAGLTVSMDVTVKSRSPTWSLCYERKRLAETVDFMMLMAYDQYTAGSTIAGPNSALTWTEQCVETTLEEIPARKLVLGMPFYMRLWKETKNASGGTEVSQIAVGMDYAQKWLRDNDVTPVYQEETGLMYAEKRMGDENFKLWIEDASSIAKRLELAGSYGLAGVAAWRRGFENAAVWDAVWQYDQSR